MQHISPGAGVLRSDSLRRLGSLSWDAKYSEISSNASVCKPNAQQYTSLGCTLFLQVLLEHEVPIISFYFGLPGPDLLSRIKAAGVYTMGTATSLKEAQYLQTAGNTCTYKQR